MSELIASISQYFQTLPWLELTAMVMSLAYVFLAARGSIWCWPAAFISTTLYTYIFFDVMLLMDSALNAYYLFMAIYGFWQWSHPSSGQDTIPEQLPIVKWRKTTHMKICASLAVVSILLGYLVSNYTPAHFPYLDTTTTVFAVFATYLVTQKVLENWLYWVVIDFVSIYLYVEKQLVPTTVLFVIFVFMAVYGYFHWSKLYRQQLANE